MRSEQFPECCGLNVISDLWDMTSIDLKRAVAEARCERRGGIIAVTATGQSGEASKLRANGFKDLREFRNPNTGNTLTVWFLELTRKATNGRKSS